MLNVGRITSKIRSQRIRKFSWSKDVDPKPVMPSVPSVSKACRHLLEKEVLEAIETRPPRSSIGKRTPHYRLPVNDQVKVRKATELLLHAVGPSLINSTYAKNASKAVQAHLKSVLDDYGIKLTKDERNKIVKIISDSPEAMKRALDRRLISSLARLSEGNEGNQAVVDVLIDYLSAARIIDIADDKDRKERPETDFSP